MHIRITLSFINDKKLIISHDIHRYLQRLIAETFPVGFICMNTLPVTIIASICDWILY